MKGREIGPRDIWIAHTGYASGAIEVLPLDDRLCLHFGRGLSVSLSLEAIGILLDKIKTAKRVLLIKKARREREAADIEAERNRIQPGRQQKPDTDLHYTIAGR